MCGCAVRWKNCQEGAVSKVNHGSLMGSGPSPRRCLRSVSKKTSLDVSGASRTRRASKRCSNERLDAVVDVEVPPRSHVEVQEPGLELADHTSLTQSAGHIGPEHRPRQEGLLGMKLRAQFSFPCIS